jgi:hypothetical protein
MSERYAYCCKIDFVHEIGEALGGNKLFPSVKDLLENHKCAKHCGIVRVKVTIDEVVTEGIRMGFEENAEEVAKVDKEVAEYLEKE